MRKMKNGKRILSVFLTLSMVFSMSGAPSFAWEDAQLSKDQGLSAEFAGRKATDSNAATPSAASKRQAEIPLDDTVTKLEAGKTYTISSLEELERLTELVNDPDTNQASRETKYELLEDIGNAGNIMIGTGAENPSESVKSYFKGSFNGNGHVIRGLAITADPDSMQERLMQLASEQEMDFSFQQDNMYRRMRRLICFDMDSTLIETEVIDELAIRAGVGDEVKTITESAMRGEIDFTESFTRRVALLKGLDESVMQEIAESLPITEGVDRLMYVLKKYGYKIAILSGGFTYFGQYLQKKYGIDYVYANELEIVDGKLTGRYLGDVVDGKRKAELLRLIAQVEKVDIAQTIAVGDGANDLPMLGIAGLGIAFHAKPKVVANAKQSINTIGLDGVLYFLGFKDSYLNM